MIEPLRFNLKPNVLRLVLAAAADPGPASRKAWSVRAGVPLNHLRPALEEAMRIGALAVSPEAEGLRLLVQPVAMWRERELVGAADWAAAWSNGRQHKLDLATEAQTLTEALAEVRSTEARRGLPESGSREGTGHRNPVPGLPESGCALSVHRSALFRDPSDKALNGERSTVDRNPEARTVEHEGATVTLAGNGWLPPETEAEALAACESLLGGKAELRQWGGLWRTRWRKNPDRFRRVLAAVREEQAAGRLPRRTWGAFASDLWGRFA